MSDWIKEGVKLLVKFICDGVEVMDSWRCGMSILL